MVESSDSGSLFEVSPPVEYTGPPVEYTGPGRCPSCGRFVGPYVRCPYCGAGVGQRLAVRTLKLGSLLLAVAGLAVLLLVGARSQVPGVKIGDLVGTMNWAYVRVEGVVSRQPVYDPAADDLTFWLWDGTGEIMVRAYQAEAETLLAAESLPVMGDDVSLAGTLRIKEEFVYLVLNDPEQMEVRPAEPLALSAAEVDAGQRYQKVRLRGVIREQRKPYDGLSIASLWDASGEIELALPGGLAVPPVGQAVEVVGAVDLYRDTVQVSVGRVADLVLLGEELPIAPLRDIGSLSVGDVGRLVAVEGRIAAIDLFSAGVKWTVADGSGEVTLLLWQDFYDALLQVNRPAPGALIRAQGLVAEYRGELEIVPELPADVEVLAPAEPSGAAAMAITPTLPESGVEPTAIVMVEPTGAAATELPPLPIPLPSPTLRPTLRPTPVPTPLPSLVPSPTSRPESRPSPTPPPTPPPTPRPMPATEARTIGAITVADLGRTVTIELAGIAGVDYLSSGVKYTLTDTSGSLALLLWQDVLEETTDRHDLLPGSQVRVTGRIDEYQGELEIVPRGGDGVTVVNRGGRPPVEERAVAQITPADEGRVLVVQGTLSRIEGRGWLRLWLGDGSGEMLIFCPERLVPYLPAGLGPGTRLRVTGEVEIYQGSLEIIPLAGADVEVQ